MHLSDPDLLRWALLAGSLMLFVTLVSGYVRRLPLSGSVIYLLAGIAVGPWGLAWVRTDLHSEGGWLLRMTQLAVVIAVFLGGLKLRLPLRHPAWSAVWRLAGPTMCLSILFLSIFIYYVLDLSPAYALLLAATLAPTDPVLATAVSVNDAADHDRVRYALSGDAGLNDGMAFPFVVLGLLLVAGPLTAQNVLRWATQEILWAIPLGLAVGYGLGHFMGRAAIALRSHHRDAAAPNDLLAIALTALAFATAEMIGALGFLAVFAAGVGLRHAEVRTVGDSPHPHAHSAPGTAANLAALAHPPAELLLSKIVADEELRQPAIAAGVVVDEAMSSAGTAERLLELAIITGVGVALADHWDARALIVATLLFLVVRPLATFLGLLGTPTTFAQRVLLSWFGIRGVGSLFYIAVIGASLPTSPALRELTDLVISTIALSILVHGMSTTPILAGYESWLRRRAEPR